MSGLIFDAAAPGLIISLLGGGLLILALVVGLLVFAITMIVRKVIRNKKAKVGNEETTHYDPSDNSQ